MSKDSVDIEDASFTKIYTRLHGSQITVAGAQKLAGNLLQLTSPVLLQKVIDQITLFFQGGTLPVQKVKQVVSSRHV